MEGGVGGEGGIGGEDGVGGEVGVGVGVPRQMILELFSGSKVEFTEHFRKYSHFRFLNLRISPTKNNPNM